MTGIFGKVEPDPEFTECYSDHYQDISTRLVCDICGSTDPDVVGYVLPGTERLRGVDPVAAAKRVLREQSAKIVDGVLLDAFTASAITTVYAALATPEAREKLRSMPLTIAATVCFKVLDKARRES